PDALPISAQIGEPGAFGDRRHAVEHRLPQFGAQTRVVGERGGVNLGKSATEIQPARARGQVSVSGRVEGRDRASRCCEELRRLGVSEDRKSTRLNSSHVKISYA